MLYPLLLSCVVAMGLMVCASTANAAGAPDALGDPLATLRVGHPRLFVLAEDWERLKETVRKDEVAGRWYQTLKAQAERMLAEKPIEHVLIGPRLLDKSRKAVERISTLAAIYRIGGDRRFAERAKVEMLAAAAFPDWNPAHFLDTAEMSNALGIGYDWLYDFLSADERATIRGAIVKLAMGPGLRAYAENIWWTNCHHNWGQVCNGGLSVGALAIADEERVVAGEILRQAREGIVPSMHAFAPDGGCPEGPGYWGYATQYHVFYLAAIETALGTDWGMKKIPGVSEAGLFRIHSIGPMNQSFNFADAHAGTGAAPQMFWLAMEFDRPVFAAHERAFADRKPSIWHLLWYRPGVAGPENYLRPRSLDAVFRGVNVAFFRSKWDDPKAVYVGMKGGDNKANHSHLDLGTFVMDAVGYRWAVDLGPDDYNLPGYWDARRWTYYRLKTEGQNTLMLDDENQEVDGKAPLVAFHSAPERALAVTDLTDGYRRKAKQVLRGIELLERRRVLVQDEIQTEQPVRITWNFHTPAKIQLEGTSAVLSQGEAKLHARILSPEGARFEVVSANPPKPQAQQPEVSNLVIRLIGRVGTTRIIVLLSPGGGESEAAPPVEMLEKWIEKGRLGEIRNQKPE